MNQFERLIFITRCLNEYGCIDKKRVYAEFEVDSRTFGRDIRYLRERCDMDIEYDRMSGKYISKKPVDIFSPGRYLLLYSYITGMARSFSLMPLVAKDICGKISRILDAGHLSLSNAIIYQFPSIDTFDAAVLDELIRSFKERICCRIAYAKPGEEAKERVIEPLRFINYDGQWYVLAFCRASGEMRQFSLSRIRSAMRNGEVFVSGYSGEDLNRMVEAAYGIMKTSFGESEPVWATVRFTGRAAAIIATQEWHPGQKMESDPGGQALLLTVPVESYEEILRRVLFYGPEAEAVSPRDFRDLWMGKIREMHKKFCEK